MWFSGFKKPAADGALLAREATDHTSDLLSELSNSKFDVIQALARFNSRRVKQMIAAINLLIVFSLVNNMVFNRGIWLSISASTVFFVLMLARRLYAHDRPVLAQFLFIWTIFAAVTYVTWQADGLRDQVILGNSIVLVFAAILSTPRHFLVVYFAVMANAILLGVANEFKWVDYSAFRFDWSNVGDVLMLYSVTAVTVFMLANDMRHLLARYNSEYRKAKSSENEIYRLANHDALTGLPNLFSAQKRFRDHYASSVEPCALFLVGLDNFKAVNDSLGHVAGDMVLKSIAERLLKIATADCLVFRVAGDVFGLLTSRTSNAEDVANAAALVSAALTEPLGSGPQHIMLTCSVGAALRMAGDEDDFEDLRRKADIALYRAKGSGRNVFRLFDETMNSQTLASVMMAAKMKTAIDKQEFQLYFQPKVELETARITGAEALLRWFPEGEAQIRPDEFIPVAESTGMIVEIGAWVIQNACIECRRLQELGLKDFAIAVNVSAVQFRRGNLEHVVLDALYVSGLDPKYLELELTESMLLEDEHDIKGQIARLARKGVSFSVDDFGKGFSNLGNLSRFQVSALKIDQSFVMSMFDSQQNAALVEAIVRMAKALGLKIVAEGVENQRAANMLGLHGVDHAQGFFWSRPLPIVDFTAYALPDGLAKIAKG